MSIARELLPCPFCSSKARAQEDDSGRGNWIVRCNDCRAQTHWFQTEIQAIEQWNRRVLSAQVEELRAALKPFAAIAEQIANDRPGWNHDAFILNSEGSMPMELRIFRRARTALKPETAK